MQQTAKLRSGNTIYGPEPPCTSVVFLVRLHIDGLHVSWRIVAVLRFVKPCQRQTWGYDGGVIIYGRRCTSCLLLLAAVLRMRRSNWANTSHACTQRLLRLLGVVAQKGLVSDGSGRFWAGGDFS